MINPILEFSQVVVAKYKVYSTAPANVVVSTTKSFVLKNILYTLVSKPDFISYDIRFLPNFFVKLFRKKKIVLGCVGLFQSLSILIIIKRLWLITMIG